MRVLFSVLLLIKITLSFGQVDSIAPKLDNQKGYIEFVKSKIKYPNMALLFRIQGQVDFSFHITSQGCIDSIKILNTPHKLLSRKVIQVLKKTRCKWIPASSDGVPIRVLMHSNIKFKIE